MDILVLGGTIFLGRHIVEAALERGHRVTLFNRGKHNSDLFPNVEKVQGNRESELSALAGRHWDAVVDTCGYVPRVVRASAQALADSVDLYVFISSLSVYVDSSAPGTDESGTLDTIEDITTEVIDDATYGPLKALCEQAVEAALPGRALLVRPGYIVGPHDGSDRFTYWPRRVAQGGEVLVPGALDQVIQIIDVRDLAEWIVRMVEQNQTGAYNACGPDYVLTLGQVLDETKNVSGSDAHYVVVPDDVLTKQGLEPWKDLPFWTPPAEDGTRHSYDAFDARKAIGAGLTFRALSDTIRDTLAWDATRPAASIKRFLEPERETASLEQWQQAQSQAVVQDR